MAFVLAKFSGQKLRRLRLRLTLMTLLRLDWMPVCGMDGVPPRMWNGWYQHKLLLICLGLQWWREEPRSRALPRIYDKTGTNHPLNKNTERLRPLTFVFTPHRQNHLHTLP